MTIDWAKYPKTGDELYIWLEAKDKDDASELRPYDDHHFNALPLSCQWGILLEFFDFVGIPIDDIFQGCQFDQDHYEPEAPRSHNRKEAQKETIKKAFEHREEELTKSHV